METQIITKIWGLYCYNITDNSNFEIRIPKLTYNAHHNQLMHAINTKN